ncbi:MAG: MBL fold metallo-hydrolase [Bacillota bacterium]
MQLNRIKENVFYIDAPANMGVVTNGRGEALLVDTGLDESVARKVRRLLQENGFALRAIIITHGHADHCGGTPHLVRTTGARVYASPFEKTVLEFPIWEPLYLFGGAYPAPALRSKFFLAPGVQVDEVLGPGRQTVAGCEVEIVALPGHTLGQVGVAVQGVLFSADAVIAPEFIAKHGVPLNADLEQTLATFDLLERRPEGYFVPAHGEPVGDIGLLVAANRRRVQEALGRIIALLERPRTAEEILALVCEAFGVQIAGTGQYYLMHLTVMAYLGYLLGKREIAAFYNGNRQYFRRS